MTGRADRQLVGRWRIIEADLWERDFLDLLGPAMLTIEADGSGEIAFGAVQAGLDIDYAPSRAFFTWAGFDEMDEVTGAGSAELRTSINRSWAPRSAASRALTHDEIGPSSLPSQACVRRSRIVGPARPAA